MLKKVLWISAALAAILAAMAASRMFDLGGERRSAPAPVEMPERPRDRPPAKPEPQQEPPPPESAPAPDLPSAEPQSAEPPPGGPASEPPPA